MIIDLHVHSRHTAGCAIDPAEAVRKAAEAGLDGVCFTDLDTLGGLAELRALAEKAPIKVFAGVELATDRGHYLCFFPEPGKLPDVPQLFGQKPWAVRDVLARVAELGGVAVAAHPFDREMEAPGGDIVYTLRGLAGIEVHNPRRKAVANELAVEAAENLRLPCIAGSDSRPSLEHMGQAGTLFKRAVASEADLVEQIRKGEVWAVTLGGQPSREDRRPPARDHRGGERDRRGKDRDRGRGGHGGGGRGRFGGRDARPQHEDLEEPPKRPSSAPDQPALTAPQGEPPPLNRGREKE